MISNALVENCKVTFAAVWGQSSLKCQNPEVNLLFGDAHLFPVWEEGSIVLHCSTLVRGRLGLAAHGLDGIGPSLLWAKALTLCSGK